MSTKYKLVRISLEEYRALYDAGAWVCGMQSTYKDPSVLLGFDSDHLDPEFREMEWTYCYTRVEQERG